jgi:hypothetical protein
MFSFHLLLFCLIISLQGCKKDSKKPEPTPEVTTAEPAAVPETPIGDRVASPAADRGASDEVLKKWPAISRVADSELDVLFRLDLSRLPSKAFAWMETQLGTNPACSAAFAQASLVAIGVSDVALRRAYVKGTPERSKVLDCINGIAPGLAQEGANNTLQIANYVAAWSAAGVEIKESNEGANDGVLPADLLDALKKQEQRATVLAIWGPLPQHKTLGSEVVIFLDDNNFEVQAVVQGESAGVAEEYINGIVRGFAQGAQAKGLSADKILPLFKITEKDNTATLKLKVSYQELASLLGL